MYDSYFGLTGLPFQLTPDPCFLFHGKGHREGFAVLQESLAAGARVLVVTGEVGAGKTTLVQTLLASVDPAATVTAHISASSLDAEALCDRLCDAFAQPRLAEALARRDALLARLRSSPLPTLLVIDEAQHLGPSAFELLETIEDGAATAAIRLQICLVGQPELRILLNAPDRSRFRELIGVDRHLGPLERPRSALCRAPLASRRLDGAAAIRGRGFLRVLCLHGRNSAPRQSLVQFPPALGMAGQATEDRRYRGHPGRRRNPQRRFLGAPGLDADRI